MAYVGFTAGDGEFGSTQTISNFNVSRAGVNNVLPSTTPLLVAAGGTLDLNGVNQAVGDLSGAGVVTNTSIGATLTVGGDNTSQTFSGTLQDGGGPLALTVVGGTLTLSGTNNYSGGTTVNGGTLIADQQQGPSRTARASISGVVWGPSPARPLLAERRRTPKPHRRCRKRVPCR